MTPEEKKNRYQRLPTVATVFYTPYFLSEF